jgi:hypothetical protein
MKIITIKPNEGIHSYRIFNLAIVDVIGTILGAFILHRWLKISFAYVLLGLFLTGIVCHRIFRVNSTINMMIFGKV